MLMIIPISRKCHFVLANVKKEPVSVLLSCYSVMFEHKCRCSNSLHFHALLNVF